MNVPSYRAADRFLDEDLAASLVSEQFPDLAHLEVRRWTEGWDNEVYSAGDEWVFRFPKRAGNVPWLDREDAILRLVSRETDVPVPFFERYGYPTADFPYPFVGYRRLPGRPADRAGGSPAVLAAGVGRALGALHALDPRAVPLTPTGWEDEDPDAVRRELVEEAPFLYPLLPPDIAAAAAPYLRGEIERPVFDGPPVFIHNDIGPDHLLADSGGDLTGIIDFADAMVGDPVGDFVGLVGFGGYPFVADVLGHYERPLDETFHERLHWSARVHNLLWLAEADDVDDPDDVATHLAWVGRAFGDATVETR